MSIAGKVAVVTGAASGIGLATARRLAQDGAQVAIWDINLAGAQAAADELIKAGKRALAAKVDVARRADVDAALVAVRKELGPVAILVNNAGVTLFEGFLETTEDAWDRVMNVDLKSMLVVTQAVLPDMLAAQWGRV